MRWILATLFCVVVIIFMGVLLIGAASNGYDFLGSLKAIDVASISLAAAAVSLTSVGIVVAVVGVFGYSQIKDAAIHASTQEASRIAAEKSAEVASSVASRTVTEYLNQPSSEEDLSEEIVEAVVKDENGT